jgi:hypothetical protein
MSKNTNEKLCLGKPKVIDGSTLAMDFIPKEQDV